MKIKTHKIKNSRAIKGGLGIPATEKGYRTRNNFPMTKENQEMVEKVKNYVFDRNKCVLCHNMNWCGNDWYCPTYDCGALDKLKSFSDRQWNNAIKKVQKVYDNRLTFEDLVDEVLLELKTKHINRRK